MAVQRVFTLLQMLANHEAPYTLARLSALLDIPKPSALSLLNEMAVLGYVRRTDQGYALGAGAYRLGLQLMSADSLSRVIRDGLREVSDALNMTVAFGYLDRANRALVYADRYEALSPVRYVVRLGAPLAIHSRALGRLLLANEPPHTWAQWLGNPPYTAFTRHTVTGFDALSRELRKIRRDGLARTASQQHEGIGSCAVPVFDAQGAVACGIATQTLVTALDAHGPLVAKALKATAARLGEELAARGITREALPQHI